MRSRKLSDSEKYYKRRKRRVCMVCECRGSEVGQRGPPARRRCGEAGTTNVMLGCRGRELIGVLLPGSLVLGTDGFCYYGPRVFSILSRYIQTIDAFPIAAL
jgi:hypothetical protein